MNSENTLHDAIRIVLENKPKQSASIEEILEVIEELNLYRKQNGDLPSGFQISSRGVNYPEVFEVKIKLRS